MAHTRSSSSDDMDLKDRIQKISEGLTRDRDASHAGVARQVAAAVGAETPATVLPDIRDINNRTLSVLEGIRDMQIETERNDAVRHKELCTLLMGLMGTGVSSVGSRTPLGSTPQPSGKEQYYYGNTALISGVHAVACVLMHLDILATEHPQFQKIQSSDSTFMDIKDWYVTASYLINADKQSKAGLRIPKPSDEDFKAVCRTLAASAPGRRPRCQASNIYSLLTDCPGVMNTVEWVRQALLRCRGILSPEREHRFKYFHHPFINEEMDLAVEPHKIGKLPSRAFHRSVHEMKATQKKVYMKLVLEDDMPYMQAASAACKQ